MTAPVFPPALFVLCAKRWTTPRETIPLIARGERYSARTALIDDGGRVRYGELLARSADAARVLLGDGRTDLAGARVVFLTPPGIDYVVAQWGIFRAGGVAVPFCTVASGSREL